MPSTIEQTKEAIGKLDGKASKHEIARELKISLDYAGLILGELKRKGEIAFADGFYVLTSTEKVVAPDEEPKKSARRPGKSKGTKKAKRPSGKERPPHPLTSILGVSESLARTLEEAGYPTTEALADAPINKLMTAAKLELHTAAQLINQARKIKG